MFLLDNCSVISLTNVQIVDYCFLSNVSQERLFNSRINLSICFGDNKNLSLGSLYQ